MSEEKAVETQPQEEQNAPEEQKHKSVWQVLSQRAFLTVFVGNILVCISFNIINAGLQCRLGC
ncbi:MAG: hypothetical protein ACLU06_06220 [Eggerthellaceae bacterium]